ncbi:MAG TPA: PIN domain-containing protein [Vitreimonas sp.]|nr:PIN domain-containing protein [Vitreimonas sp.]
MVLTWLTDPRNPRPDWEDLTRGRVLCLSFATVGEILHGAQRWSQRRRDGIERRLASWPVVPGTIGVARKYAELRARYFDQIGENDLWIAACALRGPDLIPLATEDQAFDRVASDFGLVVERPPTAARTG